MDGSRVIFMLMLIVMPLLLSAGIVLPFLADSLYLADSHTRRKR